MKKIILIILVCIGHQLPAQNINAYKTYNKQFKVFDSGVFSIAEASQIDTFYLGYSYVAYISNNSMLKMYWKKDVNTINEAAFVSKIKAMNGLFAYAMGQQLKVIYNGVDTTLSGFCKRWDASDSLVLYYDEALNMHYIYANRHVFSLDDVIGSNLNLLDPVNASLGGNTFCYLNSFGKIRALYNSTVYDLTDYTPGLLFEAGNNICVYNNVTLTKWKTFCNGYTSDLEVFQPLSYKLGIGMVAYVDNVSNFKVYYNDTLITLLRQEPITYTVVDSTIEYSDNLKYWYIFQGGKTTLVEKYIPKQIKVSNATVAYIDYMGQLKVFQNGVAKVISVEQVSDYSVNGNTVTYTLGANDVHFYWNGQKY